MTDTKEKTRSYELLYFGVRGRGEMIRLLFHITKTQFTDTLVGDWQTMKPNTPLGQLPVLNETVDGEKFQIPQSFAIMRHLARLKGLYGANERERVRTDVVSDTIVDWRQKFGMVFRDKEKLIEYFNKDLPNGLALIQKVLENSGSKTGLFVGDALTYADIVAFDTLDTLLNYKPTVLKEFGKLAQFVEMMQKHENLKDYLASRKKMEVAFTID